VLFVVYCLFDLTQLNMDSFLAGSRNIMISGLTCWQSITIMAVIIVLVLVPAGAGHILDYSQTTKEQEVKETSYTVDVHNNCRAKSQL